jgi:alpha-amylase
LAFFVVLTASRSCADSLSVLSCKSFTTGSDGTISVSYAAPGYGGMPYIFMSQADVQSLGVCSTGGVPTTASNTTTNVKSGSTSVVEGVPILALLGSAAVALLGTLVL